MKQSNETVVKRVTLDYEKMVREIDAIATTEWHANLEMMHMHDEPYSQEEAEELAKQLGKVYMISHCVTCRACQTQYVTRSTADTNEPQSATGDQEDLIISV